MSYDERIAELERRVAALESRAPAAATSTPADLVELLRSRAGAVLYGGTAALGGKQYMWAREHAPEDVMTAPWAALAPMLERLASPARLTLLAALLNGPRTRRELQEVLGETSTGHLYHHLRDLQGLVVQPRRGEYELAPQAVIPLLTVAAVAMDLISSPDAEPQEA
jgi:DNA-binding HxlR family transcriptional regulator